MSRVIETEYNNEQFAQNIQAGSQPHSHIYYFNNRIESQISKFSDDENREHCNTTDRSISLHEH